MAADGWRSAGSFRLFSESCWSRRRCSAPWWPGGSAPMRRFFGATLLALAFKLRARKLGSGAW